MEARSRLVVYIFYSMHVVECKSRLSSCNDAFGRVIVVVAKVLRIYNSLVHAIHHQLIAIVG